MNRSENLRRGRQGLLILTIVSIIFTVLCVAGAAFLAKDAAPPAPTAGPPPKTSVLQGTLQRPSRPANQRNAAQARLRQYGWVDKAHERVHIPIDVTMDVWLAQQGGAP